MALEDDIAHLTELSAELAAETERVNATLAKVEGSLSEAGCAIPAWLDVPKMPQHSFGWARPPKEDWGLFFYVPEQVGNFVHWKMASRTLRFRASTLLRQLVTRLLAETEDTLRLAGASGADANSSDDDEAPF